MEQGTTINLGFAKILDDSEKDEIINMLYSLGKNDASGELKQLDAYDVYLKDKVETTKREKERLCPMITKLSFLFALGLAILFI